MRIFIYSRKSVYTGKGESIENQVEMCRQYIASRIDGGGDAEITVYEDEGFSGKNLDRPQFQKMLTDSKRQKPDYIVCYRLDRISRSVGDFAPLVEDLITRDVGFICIKEQFDTSTPMGKAMMYIASVFAQLERETIAERVRDNMLMLARTGRWLGGPPPTGFLSEKVEEVVVDGKVKTSCKLKWNPEEITIAKTVYQKFLELHSLSGVSKYLMRQGVRSRTGKYYSIIGIKEMLKNPVYCIADKDARDYFLAQEADVCFHEADCGNQYGLLAYNKRDHSKKGAPRQEKNEWIVAVGKHRGIVSGKDWVAVQNILEVNRPSSPEPKTFNDYSLLSGVLRCKKCGARMFSKIRANNPELYDYICSAKLRGGSRICDCQNLGGKEADDDICNFLLDYMDEDSKIFKLLEDLRTRIQKEDTVNPLTEIELQIARCNREIKQLVSSLSQPNVSPSLITHINSRVSELDGRLKGLHAQKKHLQAGLDYLTDADLQLDVLSRMLAYFKENFKALTIHEKRELVKLLVQKIEWDGENCDIFMYGE